jgi:drug/metabolite transporter (DMT)-like permease
MIYLIVAGSILGYSLFVYALRYLPAQQVSVYAYVNPIVAVFLGWLLLKEKISPMAIYAMFVTMIGVYLVNRGMSAARKKG